jgi:hypothetical protein
MAAFHRPGSTAESGRFVLGGRRSGAGLSKSGRVSIIVSMRNSWGSVVALWVSAWVWFATASLAPAATNRTHSVRMIYLVSKDREEKPEYTAAIEHAIRDLQGWYGKQLGGPTFRLHDPVVEVVKSDKNADRFYGNPNGDDKDNWGFNNTLAEAGRLVGAKYNDLENVWVVYSDGPGDKGRGTATIACLPEEDLIGLVGRHPTQTDPLRWIAGLGHELGHAFGLPHPTDTQKHADALMWTGIYGKYPDKAYLTDEDKQSLLHSPFFFGDGDKPVGKLGPVVARYAYEGGAFEQHEGKSPIYWKESKNGSPETHLFQEDRRDAENVYLRDDSRGFIVRLPIKGGPSAISNDKEKTWFPLFPIERPLVAMP